MMRRIFTKITAALLCLALLAACLPTAALAADSGFTVQNGTENTDYTLSGNTLTIKTSEPLTISTTGDDAITGQIVIAEGVTANLTLNGLNLKGASVEGVLSTSATSAIKLSDNSTLTLKLAQGSSNTLTGGSGESSGPGAPAIRVPGGTSLTVLCANQSGNDHICSDACGSLSATGGSSTNSHGGVGIGGAITVDFTPGNTNSEGCGTVLLLGGNITVNGGNSGSGNSAPKDIGGANGSSTGGAGGTVIILTHVTTGNNTPLDIGAGSGTGTAYNGAGIKPSSGDNTYEVYGNLELLADLTIPAGVTVTIPSGATLTVPNGKTLTNHGTITINGNLTNDGTIDNYGEINGTVSGTQPVDKRPAPDPTPTPTPPPYIPPTYRPSIVETEHGAVTATPAAPRPGQTVTITLTPDENYKVNTIIVTDAAGNRLPLESLGGGKYAFTQPAGAVTIAATFIWDNPFDDVRPSAWYAKAVEYVHTQGIMAGTSDTAFAPNSQLTRAEAVQILYNLEGQPEATGETTFTDVKAGQWYSPAVAWAHQTGVAGGYEDGTFQPGKVITRQEFAQMLYNYAHLKGLDTAAQADLTKFPDASQVSPWAATALSWANAHGLINGHTNGAIDPKGTTTRAQAASMLMHFDLNLVK